VTLWGRREECAAIDRLLAGVRAGRSRALVVRGEPGIGKTALLSYAADTAPDFQVIRAEGVQSEMELPFASLRQLCGRMLNRLDGLPDPQRDALGVAFGLRSGGAPDRFLVGLAVLGLLAEVAADQPLLCLIDDAQWLDQASAQALAFVARRLDAESVAVILGTRDARPTPDLAGVAELALGGLSDADSRALLASVVPGRLDERVRDRIIAESGGNPLALLELSRGVTAAELAGGFGVAGPQPVAGRIEQSFLRQIAPLPEPTRRLLLLAAVEPTGDPALLSRAADRLGLGVEAADAAGSEGLLEIGARVSFRHSLVRSAVYRSASPPQRRAVHLALADATDPEADPDRRAWHLAQAAAGPDEDVAANLERSAERAHARGGLAAAAAFLQRASELTPDQGRRAARALAAAQAQARAGAPHTALGLLCLAEAGPLDELQRARVDLLRGQVAFAVNRGSDAPPLLLNAARRLTPLDASLARETYLDALSAATFVGRLSSGVGLAEVARAARAALPPAHHPGPADLLLDGLVLLLTEGYAAGVPTLKQALRAFRSEAASREEEIRWLWLAGHVALDLWDDESWRVLAERHVRVARDSGALSMLPIALNTRIGVHLSAGEFAAAASLIEEVKAVTGAAGGQLAPYVGLSLAAFEGRRHQVLPEATVADVVARGEGLGLTIARWANAVILNALGRYEDAASAAERASEHPEDLRFYNRALVEFIEAAARSGKVARAGDALDRLSESTRASGSDWALGIEARSRALVSEGHVAENLYREAIDRLSRPGVRVALARAHLVYGEWLRRENRRIDAREQLRTAHQMFVTMGADGFAERAARELGATGERVRKRTPHATVQLTARELQIAQLAGDGLSNPEIAAQLFMSRRTVEYHLHKIFTKLAIRSRNELHGVLANSTTEGHRDTP
jgi:DNA-binding CsgD family transcriptional regulator/tetratricopeptide (TPR) repeat protein